MEAKWPVVQMVTAPLGECGAGMWGDRCTEDWTCNHWWIHPWTYSLRNTWQASSSSHRWEHYEDHVSDFSSVFHPAHPTGGQGAVSGSKPAPHCRLPHKPVIACESTEMWAWHASLQHWGTTGNHFCSIPVHPLHLKLHLQLLNVQKFCDNSVIVGLITDGDDREYRELTQNLLDWCLQNCLHINPGKPKGLVVDFSRGQHSPSSLMGIQGYGHW